MYYNRIRVLAETGESPQVFLTEYLGFVVLLWVFTAEMSFLE